MPAPAKKPAAPTAKNAAKSATKPVETKPVAKSAAPVPPAAPAAVPAKAAATKPAAAAATKSALSPAERMKMIAETAYYLAQKRGFTGGNELSDWMAAEKQVDTLVAKRG